MYIGSSIERRKRIRAVAVGQKTAERPFLEEVSSTDVDLDNRYFARKVLNMPTMRVGSFAGRSALGGSSLDHKLLIKLLTSFSPSERIEAAMAAARCGDQSLGEHLLRQLRTENDGRVRATLIRSLGTVGSEDDIPTLDSFRTDPDPRTRANLAEALGVLRSQKALGTLHHLLDDQDHRVRTSALLALHSLIDIDVSIPCWGMINKESLAEQVSATFCLASLACDSSFDILEFCLSMKREPVRIRAKQGLKNLAMKGNSKARALCERAHSVPEIEAPMAFMAEF